MKPLRYPTNAEEHAYMRKRQAQNRAICTDNENENWMYDKLKSTEYDWTRQAQWGYRLFDFWCHELGIAVEVDGPGHDEDADSYRDEYNFRRSAIVVLRVRNGSEAGAERALRMIRQLDTWEHRREETDVNSERGWKERVELDDDRSLLEEYLER